MDWRQIIRGGRLETRTEKGIRWIIDYPLYPFIVVGILLLLCAVWLWMRIEKAINGY